MLSLHGKLLNACFVHDCEENVPVKLWADPEKLCAMNCDGFSCPATCKWIGRGFQVLLSHPSARTFSKVFRPNPFLAKEECLLLKNINSQLGKEKKKQSKNNPHPPKNHPEAKQQKLRTSGRQQAVTQEISPTHPLQREELSVPSDSLSVPQHDSAHQFLD